METEITNQQFEQYYRSLFPEAGEYDKWLRTMTTPSLPILRFSAKNASVVHALWHTHGLTWKPLEWYPLAVEWPPEIPYGDTLPGYDEHLVYPMNASSLIPVLALDVQPADMVLDACAAPGGKALAIVEQLNAPDQLIANDTSLQRSRRLHEVLEVYGYGSAVLRRKKAETLFQEYPDQFDKILLDAPCSSEKHILAQPRRLAQWSPARIKALRQRQIALVSGLFLALKPGGRLVYATCAITPEENEEVIATLLKKKKTAIRLLDWTIQCPGEDGMPESTNRVYKTDFDLSAVRRVLPHHTTAVVTERVQMDPMFVAVIERLH